MLQFKKDSVFTRNNKDKSKVDESLPGGVLAVWGSPSSGKTTVAVKLAKYLAEHKKNVILVLCDMTAPMLPCICFSSSLECLKDSNRPFGSLGSILSATHVTDHIVKNNIITHKKMAYLTMIGMLKGENEYTYASILGHANKKLLNEEVFARLAKKYNKANVQIILKWHTQAGNILIPGSKSPSHIQSNGDIFDFELTTDEMMEISALNKNKHFAAIPAIVKKLMFTRGNMNFNKQP